MNTREWGSHDSMIPARISLGNAIHPAGRVAWTTPGMEKDCAAATGHGILQIEIENGDQIIHGVAARKPLVTVRIFRSVNGRNVTIVGRCPRDRPTRCHRARSREPGST